MTVKGKGHDTSIRLGPNISKAAGDVIANYQIVCCEAVRLAILATAWLLILDFHVELEKSHNVAVSVQSIAYEFG